MIETLGVLALLFSFFLSFLTNMSRYPPEADEAQHRHYDDGHFVNPYDAYDPFNPPVATYAPPQPPLVPPPSPANQQPFHVTFGPYSQSSPPPPPPAGPFAGSPPFSSPPPGPVGVGGFAGPSSSPIAGYTSQSPDFRSASPSVPYRPSLQSMYDAHEDQDQDNGNIPLLNRPSSQARLRIPSQLDEEEDSPSLVDDNRSESQRPLWPYSPESPQAVQNSQKSRVSQISLLHLSFFLTDMFSF